MALCASFVIETGAKRGRPPRDRRRVIDGVLWVALTGGAWRELPAEYSNWRGAADGAFLRMASRMRKQAALAAVCALPGRRAAR
ncbi:transposase [Methylosinus sporium]|uniref:Insertion element IS402-like domain-containing protein n=1 Tax=Methylosinus sporium TaxID=428 RepID=A0A2U1SUE2_METSR|nr:transposase [Methylosinus sporium]PWB95212.1 hypothetical protein C5689_03450 [Methylosinus sporium]